ncbi:MAG: 30S ribosomal protein S11 [Candidatus Wildermuthbacteria bacterium RIFCSPLOWO2_02_FULL_47_9c]|uniref:Small ribosomal subunit protein uS11 n=1 Tax=Candidatus Wildermuthbacteria bacterium RIFCSPLOWO2_02_FULL_47_9c TaxID=1802466 RepID=A0A1G2RSJ0_9BACT|nr:MAG: 30S ribosomal protein S11 [Candidatus Wildermuthbacteria bacterium GWA1_49_26]OHA66342.1 MAG: 30S ribosomal protein S11 [Candidatus Wildermuthbacteria bacterium RIFCSPHIGHO2_01_FULL_50_47]OHA69991.1 MAG: 30S ribosomal protein S11 [Candidatus Wildermuthbacteria bacterium RIFCSPHIGHO2_02_FULL_49_17]OHA71734.1 MAG: 30S ribosomal protein S11 [Candidatus Wildermuthbacteria bacterium RIFCSPHIGHO2_12_FULL_49_13]OHA74428.1 MAG: 30S ribosomal protein S11 [Candidatus Wildermuthbacteria bacterium 
MAKAARVSSSRRVPEGRVYVYSSYNNTLMSLCDAKGNLLAQVSAGAIGFKGTKKSTPFAASKVADALSQIAKNRGVEKVEIFIKGVGSGRDSALRALGSKGFEVSAIRDITPIPHNGPRSRKVRRV